MITKPMDVLEKYEIRKSKKQKSAFISAVSAYVESQKYTVRVESGSLGSRNVVFGNPEQAKFLVTAHYDTCARLPFPNFITPCNLCAYLAYQLLIVGLFLVVAFVAAITVGMLLEVSELSLLVWYVVYFGMLLWMIFGPANRHTANDNTSGVVTLLEIASSLPDNLRDRVAFVLFDLEEAGLVGSSSYRSKHKKETDQQIVLNLDCIGDGNELMMFPTKKLKMDTSKMELLDKICGCFGGKSLKLHKKGFSMYPSDQKNFPLGVGIAAFRRAKGVGLYCSRIHTSKDSILDQTNVNILRAALITLIGNEV